MLDSCTHMATVGVKGLNVTTKRHDVDVLNVITRQMPAVRVVLVVVISGSIHLVCGRCFSFWRHWVLSILAIQNNKDDYDDDDDYDE